jgi:hypothetical protein
MYRVMGIVRACNLQNNVKHCLTKCNLLNRPIFHSDSFSVANVVPCMISIFYNFLFHARYGVCLDVAIIINPIRTQAHTSSKRILTCLFSFDVHSIPSTMLSIHSLSQSLSIYVVQGIALIIVYEYKITRTIIIIIIIIFFQLVYYPFYATWCRTFCAWKFLV